MKASRGKIIIDSAPTAVFPQYEASKRALELVWMFRRREKSFTPAGIRVPYRPAGSAVVQCRQKGVGVCIDNCSLNPLNPELNPICHLLALLGAHHFLHVSRIRVKSLTIRLLMSYIYAAPILDVSRSHTTTQHSR